MLVVDRLVPQGWQRGAGTAPKLAARLAATPPLPEGSQLIVLGSSDAWLRGRAMDIVGSAVFPVADR